MTTISESEQRKGFFYGLSCYGLWGLFPLYFKLVAEVNSLEVLAHRVAWSFLFLSAIVTGQRRWKELRTVLWSGRVMGTLIASTLLIAINWLIYIYSVSSGQVLQSSLGYFMTPLMNVMLGVLFLHERLRPFQRLAIGMAALGVLVLAILAGELPWIALVLAVSFSFYGLLRKTVAADSLMCLTVETLVLFPLATGYLIYLNQSGTATAVGLEPWLILSLSGITTAVPLLLFAGAARRLRLSTMGILQFLAPTIQFLLAVLVFREDFSLPQLVSFICIWTAVLVYSVDSIQSYRLSRRELLKPLGASD